MTIPDSAVIALVVVGCIVTLAGVVALFAKPAIWWRVALPLIFGFAMIGVSAFGLEFFGAYREFVEIILPMIHTPDSNTYSRAVEAITNQDLSPDNAKIAAAIMLEHPIGGLDSLVETTPGSPADPETKEVWDQFRDDLRLKRKAAEGLVEEMVRERRVDRQAFERMDRATGTIAAQKLAKDPHRLDMLPQEDREFLLRKAIVKPAVP